MREYAKPFFLSVFLGMIGVLMVLLRQYERDNMSPYPMISQAEADVLVKGRQLLAVPDDFFYYQGQPLPYLRDLNMFLLPIDGSGHFINALGHNGIGEVYMVQKEPQELEAGIGMGSVDLSVYLIDGSSYFETTISFISSAVLTFRTEAFENGNAYGIMNFYMPKDNEIGMYSLKSSEAKLSYEVTSSFLPRAERNYTLELTKNGEKNDLNLANLRKDDDWELDPLFGYSDQILQFYKEWNDFCIDTGREQFVVHYKPIDFYLDEQYMGEYLLRVPLDEKQLCNTDGVFMAKEAASKNVANGSEAEAVHRLLDSVMVDSSIQLEHYYWAEQKADGGENNVFIVPRRFTKCQ